MNKNKHCLTHQIISDLSVNNKTNDLINHLDYDNYNIIPFLSHSINKRFDRTLTKYKVERV